MFYNAKRVLTMLLLVLIICTLLLAGCSKSPEMLADPTVMPPSAEATDPPEAAETVPVQADPGLTAAALREQLKLEGKRFAVAYLGYMTYDDETVWSFLEKNHMVSEQLPLLREIPESNISCIAPQGEVYCILPVDPNATLKIYSWNSTSADAPVYDNLIFEGTAEQPVLLVCNAAFYPDTLLSIDYPDGTTYSWHPQLDEYLFVQGYWGGEYSDSLDGYDSLDTSSYNAILLDYYQTMLREPGGNWIVPTKEDLINTDWYADHYDFDGNYYLWQMTLQEEAMDVRWNLGWYENSIYEAAKWDLENKDGIAVLTIDFGEFAGIRSYNILLDKTAEMLYVAVDATKEPISNQCERQYRFLSPAGVSPEPSAMEGSWERTYVEIEGDRQPDEATVCTVQIVSEGENYYIYYDNQDFPDRSLAARPITVMAGEETSWASGCQWVGTFDGTDGNMTHKLAVNQNGNLVIQNFWTVEGAPMVSYEYFCRPD